MKPPVRLQIKPKHRIGCDTSHRSYMKKMNDRKLTSSIFIDLSKVFDTLSYAQIQENLPSTGVKGVEY